MTNSRSVTRLRRRWILFAMVGAGAAVGADGTSGDPAQRTTTTGCCNPNVGAGSSSGADAPTLTLSGREIDVTWHHNTGKWLLPLQNAGFDVSHASQAPAFLGGSQFALATEGVYAVQWLGDNTSRLVAFDVPHSTVFTPFDGHLSPALSEFLNATPSLPLDRGSFLAFSWMPGVSNPALLYNEVAAPECESSTSTAPKDPKLMYGDLRAKDPTAAGSHTFGYVRQYDVGLCSVELRFKAFVGNLTNQVPNISQMLQSLGSGVQASYNVNVGIVPNLVDASSLNATQGDVYRQSLTDTLEFEGHVHAAVAAVFDNVPVACPIDWDGAATVTPAVDLTGRSVDRIKIDVNWTTPPPALPLDPSKCAAPWGIKQVAEGFLPNLTMQPPDIAQAMSALPRFSMLLPVTAAAPTKKNLVNAQALVVDWATSAFGGGYSQATNPDVNPTPDVFVGTKSADGSCISDTLDYLDDSKCSLSDAIDSLAAVANSDIDGIKQVATGLLGLLKSGDAKLECLSTAGDLGYQQSLPSAPAMPYDPNFPNVRNWALGDWYYGQCAQGGVGRLVKSADGQHILAACVTEFPAYPRQGLDCSKCYYDATQCGDIVAKEMAAGVLPGDGCLSKPEMAILDDGTNSMVYGHKLQRIPQVTCTPKSSSIVCAARLKPSQYFLEDGVCVPIAPSSAAGKCASCPDDLANCDPTCVSDPSGNDGDYCVATVLPELDRTRMVPAARCGITLPVSRINIEPDRLRLVLAEAYPNDPTPNPTVPHEVKLGNIATVWRGFEKFIAAIPTDGGAAGLGPLAAQLKSYNLVCHPNARISSSTGEMGYRLYADSSQGVSQPAAQSPYCSYE